MSGTVVHQADKPSTRHANKPKPSTAGHQLATFIIVGGTAFLVDASVLLILMNEAELDALVARLFAIGTAMVAAWLMNRRWTFQVNQSASIAEFARYASVAGIASLVNYAIFAAVLFVDSSAHPLVALAIATCAAAVFSYTAMRFVVFPTLLN